MNQRLWFDLPATVLHAEHALSRSTTTDAATDTGTGPAWTVPIRTRAQDAVAGTGSGQPALILRTGPSPQLASNGIPVLHATPPAAAIHTDPLGAATGNSTGAVRAGTYPLPLAARSPLLGIPQRDLLRRGMHAGHVWFTVDLDPAGLRSVVTEPTRDIGGPPAGAAWRDALLTVDGLGTYPGQTCPGYRLGGDLARFRPDVLQELLDDTGYGFNPHSPVFTATDEDQTWLVDAFGDRTPVTAEAAGEGEGWWRVAHPSLPWTAALNCPTGPEPVFEPCGPDGDLVRCGVCGAVEEIAYRELPWPSGADVDTTRTCTICGSRDGSDPVPGRHRQPWPPHPEHTDTEETRR